LSERYAPLSGATSTSAPRQFVAYRVRMRSTIISRHWASLIPTGHARLGTKQPAWEIVCEERSSSQTSPRSRLLEGVG
jgi:hypothetical protein